MLVCLAVPLHTLRIVCISCVPLHTACCIYTAYIAICQLFPLLYVPIYYVSVPLHTACCIYTAYIAICQPFPLLYVSIYTQHLSCIYTQRLPCTCSVAVSLLPCPLLPFICYSLVRAACCVCMLQIACTWCVLPHIVCIVRICRVLCVYAANYC
jgi:hypothetical protein